MLADIGVTVMRTRVPFLILAGALATHAADLNELPVFSSKNGVLSITLIAREKLTPFGTFQAKAWVYEVCERTPGSSSNFCPPGSVASYGGVRLSLQGGDKLKIHLVNKLPPAPSDAKHAHDDPKMLGGNPTNLHTHGLIVEPRRAGNGLTTYGDYVFVLTYNSANGDIPAPQEGMDVSKDFTDYEIDIPSLHPSGLFWFHPHAHGLALNQVSAGLAGIITIGDPANYLCDQPGCSGYSGKIPVRQMILKDTQILVSNDLLTQQDTQFCAPQLGPDDPRNGSCPGQRYQGDSGPVDRTGGRWFFTVNGQVFPSIPLKTETGEIWRITNAAGGNTYELGLSGPDGKDMVVQVLSVDGISIVTPGNGSPDSMKKLLASKIQAVPCPAIELEPRTNVDAAPLCAQRIRMMPSSRVELWVTYRNAAGLIVSPPPAASAVLKTYGFCTGSAGDWWPEIRLAQVRFMPLPPNESAAVTSLGVRGQALSDMLPGGIFAAPVSMKVAGVSKPVSVEALKRFAGQNMSLSDPQLPFMIGSRAAATEMRKLPPAGVAALSAGVSQAKDPSCKALAEGHTRRIFFGVPAANPQAFGLGYEELDENGAPVPGTFRDITPFDHMKVDVCLPLAPGNNSVAEHWELINVAAEDHNFHIHQTKFQVLPDGAVSRAVSRAASPAMGSMTGAAQFDNVPVPVQRPQLDNCDGSIQKWRDGSCKPVPVELLIPFTEIGDFVYHCHILEHEDGGMMARIRVIPY
jgi:FtsP/CotA-like multicopper oxidase with cupredoxin domain